MAHVRLNRCYRGSIRSVASAAGTPATAFDRHAVYQILGHLRLAVVVSLAFTRFANPKLPLLNTIDAQGNISPSHPGLPGVPANIMGVRDHNLSLVFFLSSPPTSPFPTSVYNPIFARLRRHRCAPHSRHSCWALSCKPPLRSRTLPKLLLSSPS